MSCLEWTETCPCPHITLIVFKIHQTLYLYSTWCNEWWSRAKNVLPWCDARRTWAGARAIIWCMRLRVGQKGRGREDQVANTCFKFQETLGTRGKPTMRITESTLNDWHVHNYIINTHKRNVEKTIDLSRVLIHCLEKYTCFKNPYMRCITLLLRGCQSTLTHFWI